MKKSSLLGFVGSAILVLALLTGCSSAERRAAKAVAKFGPSMDPLRSELSLLPVPANALCAFPQGPEGNAASWSTGDADASHMVKTVVYDKDITVIVSELDRVRCPAGMLTIETTYGADGKSVSKQIFKVNDKEMAADKAKALLKEIMTKDAARVPAPPAVEEVNQKK